MCKTRFGALKQNHDEREREREKEKKREEWRPHSQQVIGTGVKLLRFPANLAVIPDYSGFCTNMPPSGGNSCASLTLGSGLAQQAMLPECHYFGLEVEDLGFGADH